MKEEILNKLNKFKIIDTHEHFLHEKDLAKSKVDLIDLFLPYICDNLISSGLSEKDWQLANDKTIDFLIRWEILEKYLQEIKNTTYFVALKKSIKTLFSIDEINAETALTINELLKTELNYEYIFEKHNIEKAFTFVSYDGCEYFSDSILQAVPTVSMICPKCKSDLKGIENYLNKKIENFQQFDLALEAIFENYLKLDVKAIKIGSAYMRKLNFTKSDYNRAEMVFNSISKSDKSLEEVAYGKINLNYSIDNLEPLDNYIIDKFFKMCQKSGMPIIIHTGIHAWNYNDIESCNPKHLNEILLRYRECKVVLLHCGMPYIDEAILLSKYFANVYLDLTWCNIISRQKSIYAIKQFVEQLPENKVFGFGGDYVFPHNIIGHLELAKENMATAFAEMIEMGQINMEDALRIAKKWLYYNPKLFYEKI